MKPYVYIVVRNDIKKEYQLVQACHSALESGYKFNKPESIVHLVVLSARNEEELNSVANALKNEKIGFEIFYESWNNIGNTALATEPINKVDKGVLRILPLLSF